ncbi:aldehyde dehydrogenase family protein [Halobellus captivus]|uniref:aldehyde dehydrogenase family protein n=1 Tax=Halobellus captivus TaxID=2592614 RepID=UPI0011A3CBA6|nr:aldehyde dehydrogenase family protein [Halobellus captivus]
MAASLAQTYGCFIDGEWRSIGEQFPVFDPTTQERITTVYDGGPEAIDESIRSAQESLERWNGLSAQDRGEILSGVANALRSEKEHLAKVETRESGRPLSESRYLVELGIDNFDYFAGLADKIEGKTIPVSGDRLDYTLQEPLGVTGHIIPWNASFVLASRSIAPALTCGNTVVAKASPETPLSLLEMARIANEAGLPDGVFNTVAGDGARTGAALTNDDRIRKLVFTGSRATGETVMKAAAENVVPVSLELGGKGPCIVFPDADIEQALSDMVNVFMNTGQICFATTRLFVHDDIYEEFINEFAKAVSELEYGPGIEDHDLGALISAEAQNNVDSMVKQAVSNGGRVLAGGELPDSTGHFYPATLVDEVADDALISCEEIFGPVLTAYRFEDEESVIKRANDTRYGLSAALWTGNLSRAHRIAEDIDAGTIMINEYPAVFTAAPFGGYKASGIGREKGVQALDHYTQTKNVSVSIGSSRSWSGDKERDPT